MPFRQISSVPDLLLVCVQAWTRRTDASSTPASTTAPPASTAPTRSGLVAKAAARGPIVTAPGIHNQSSSAQRAQPGMPLSDSSPDEDKDGEDIVFLDMSDEDDADAASARDATTGGPFALAVVRDTNAVAPVEPPPYALPGEGVGTKEVNTASMAYQPPPSPALLVTAHASTAPSSKGRKAVTSPKDLLPASPLSLSNASTPATRRTTRSSTHPSRPTYRRT